MSDEEPVALNPLQAREVNRPQPGHILCRIDDIADGGTKTFHFGKGFEQYRMFILRRGAELFSYANDCPHVHGPLDWKPGEFLTEDDQFIICAMHGAIFRIDDGRCVAGPCHGHYLSAVPVKVVDGTVVVTDK
ncbi:MAG: Rieske (2Fe-2S) protein [Alphaproteobacteria bacterium]|nr:Rieske (2Fe-2S) protein [Alphaproteobacteria bacterium]